MSKSGAFSLAGCALSRSKRISFYLIGRMLRTNQLANSSRTAAHRERKKQSH